MPNGGSDCCGTCWFNNKNKGESGYQRTIRVKSIKDDQVEIEPIEDSEPTICIIRNFEIDNPYWIYCANHPHHNQEKYNFPIGAVYTCNSGLPYKREQYLPSPDNEEIRIGLINILESISAIPKDEYPSSTQFDLEVVKQLGEFKDARAVKGLMRIIEFNPLVSTAPPGYPRDNKGIIALAIEALAKITGDSAISCIENYINYGLENNADPKEYAVIRYYAVLGLDYCSIDKVKYLYEVAINDPINEIAEIAKEKFNKSINEGKRYHQ